MQDNCKQQAVETFSVPISSLREELISRLWRLPVKPRNIYVGASMNNTSEARRLCILLQDAGFQVTSRWLRSDYKDRPEREDFQEFAKFEEKNGEMDIEDLERADTLILLAGVPSSAGGFHVELGYFLGAKRENIIALGDRPNVFFWTSTVRWCYDAANLIWWLRSEDHGPLASRTGDTITVYAGSNVPQTRIGTKEKDGNRKR